MQETILSEFAQLVAEYVVLQRRTDGAESVHHLRKEPSVRGMTRKSNLKPKDFSAGISVAFDNNTTVVVAVSTLTGAISRCCIFARPHVVEHGEWAELQEGDPISHSFSGEELHKLREALRVKGGREHELGRIGC